MDVEQLVKSLEKVAKDNEDDFVYRIEIDVVGAKFKYQFVCEETADGHVFVNGHGATIEEACERAGSSIEDACEQWGYNVQS